MPGSDLLQWFGLAEQPVVRSPIDYAQGRRSAAAPGLTDIQSREGRFGSDMRQAAQAAQGRVGPAWDLGNANAARDQQGQVRGQQDALGAMLMAQAAGTGPSMAQMQLQQATERNLANAMALGATQAGGSRGAGALYNIGNQHAQISGQMANDSALLRAQEMLTGRQLASQHQAQMRGQDLGLRGQDIGLANAQVGAQLQQRGMNDAMTQSAWGNLGNSLGREASNALNQGQLNLQGIGQQMNQNQFYDAASQRERDAVKAQWMELLKQGAGTAMKFAGMP